MGSSFLSPAASLVTPLHRCRCLSPPFCAGGSPTSDASACALPRFGLSARLLLVSLLLLASPPSCANISLSLFFLCVGQLLPHLGLPHTASCFPSDAHLLLTSSLLGCPSPPSRLGPNSLASFFCSPVLRPRPSLGRFTASASLRVSLPRVELWPASLLTLSLCTQSSSALPSLSSPLLASLSVVLTPATSLSIFFLFLFLPVATSFASLQPIFLSSDSPNST